MALVTTTRGEMDEAMLEKREGVDETKDYRTEWIEYWLDGELVHRSAHVTIKLQQASSNGEAARLA